MELISIVLIICLLICLVILVYLIKKLSDKSEENTYQILMNNKEEAARNEAFDKQMKQSFNYVLNQVQELRKDQALSKQSMDIVENNIRSMNQIMSNAKTRGNWGEYQLDMLLKIYAGQNPSVYSMQYTLSNGRIADAVLHMPQDKRVLCIDSKFPMENYLNMVNDNNEIYLRQFKANVKKHIDAIANKYIIRGVTSDQAIMFLPAEALFAELNAYHPDIIDYAYRKRVWIASPTTLMSTLTTIELVMKNIEKDKYTSIIHEELNKLSIDFGRYKERWDKLSRSIEAVSRDANDIHITTDKISKRFDAINNVDTKSLQSGENSD